MLGVTDVRNEQALATAIIAAGSLPVDVIAFAINMVAFTLSMDIAFTCDSRGISISALCLLVAKHRWLLQTRMSKCYLYRLYAGHVRVGVVDVAHAHIQFVRAGGQ